MTTWTGSFRGRCASPAGSEGTVRRDDSRVLVVVLNRSEPLISPARTHQSSAGRDGRPDSRCERGGSLIVLWIALTKAGTPLKITLAAFLVGDRSGMRLGDHDCFALPVVIRIVAPGPACVSRETSELCTTRRAGMANRNHAFLRQTRRQAVMGLLLSRASRRCALSRRVERKKRISVRPRKATCPCRRRCGGTARRRGSPTRDSAAKLRPARAYTARAGYSLFVAFGLLIALLPAVCAAGPAARVCVREPQGRVISALCQSRRETESR